MNKLRLLIFWAVMLVSVSSAGVLPSWIRDPQIDAGELKAVNFEPILIGNYASVVAANKTVTGIMFYNKTTFAAAPRVIVAMKSFGVLPTIAYTGLNAGFRFNIISRNIKNLTFSVTTFNVAVAALHYQYFAVLGYDNLYYLQFYTITPNTSSALLNSSAGTRSDSFVLANPTGMVIGSNYSSSQMILQVWPYYFLFTPSGSALSFNTTAAPISSSLFSVTVNADSGCTLSEIGISILYFNKTAVYTNTYQQVIDITIYIQTGSDTANAQTTTTMDNLTQQYQYRNSQEGIQGIYLPFAAVNSLTVFYFSATSSNISQMYYISVQERLRSCPNATSFMLVDDGLCYAACPSPRYATNTTYKYCKQCHYSCLQCSSADSSSACTACNITAYRNLTNVTCSCNLTFFDNGTQLCVSCHYTCLTCSSDLSNGCLSCDGSGLQRTLSNTTCPCSLGYYENTTCFSCVNLCTQCSYTQATQTYRCDACSSSLYLAVDGSQSFCVCQSGYYNNSGACSKCIDGCSVCSNGVSCDTCDSANGWSKNVTDSTCICSDRFFPTTVNSSRVCSACDSSCLTCSNALNSSCLSCDSSAHRTLSNTSCICSSGFYLNISCLACLNDCSSCSYSSSNQSYACLSCNSSLLRVMNLNQTACLCQTGYYSSNSTCLVCMDGCTDCSSAVVCNTCNVTEHWIKDSNSTCLCDSQYFKLNTVCSLCDSSCLTCINSSSYCLSCDFNLHRTLTNNTCACSVGYYENITCFSCINQCTQCYYNVSFATYRCDACNSSLYLAVDGSQSFCVCQSGYYNNSGACSKCIDGCSVCSNGVSCDTCDSSNDWQKNVSDNTCNCISGYYQANTTTCLACQTGCLSCNFNSSLICNTCNTSAHFLLSNGSCICSTGYTFVSPNCAANSSSLAICGNGLVQVGEQCDDGNTVNADGCSNVCIVQDDHYCLNNITTASICYYNRTIILLSQNVYKVPLENRVLVVLLVSAPNCNPTFLQQYLESSISIELVTVSRMLANSDITSQSVTYDPETSTASVDFQYNQDIDLTKKQVKFLASQNYSEPSTRYFFASPSTTVSLSAPDNLLLTTYSSPDQISTARAISIAFLVMIVFSWFFWLISICYHQSASAVQFMLVAQVAFEGLLQRRFITDGWVGLVLYGKYLYGGNVSYEISPTYDRLKILSLNAYLFHTLNITTVLLVLVVILMLVLFFYQTVQVKQEDNTGDLNNTEAKIDAVPKVSEEARKDVETQYQIKKGFGLFLFQVGTSFSLLTVKIVIISLMLVSASTAIDAAIVASLLAFCYFLVWFFNYKFYDNQFLNDYSFKRLLRDSEDTSKRRSLSGKVGNFFVRYYYLCIFILLALFGVADGAPPFGAAFYIIIIIISLGFLAGIIVFGVYFRGTHTIRAVFNLLALSGVMVLHLLQALQVDKPTQSLTGPIICLSLLYAAFLGNFGLMAYIQLRRHRNRKPKYRKSKVAPVDIVVEFNYTEEHQLPPIPQQEEPQQIVRRSNHSGQSLGREQNKFQSLKSKSKDNSFSQTHKKLAVPRLDHYEQTNQKQEINRHHEDEFVVVREPKQKQDGSYDNYSQAERIEIVDMSRSVSDFTKTQTKIKRNEEAQVEQDRTTDKKKNP